jgi:DNA-binding MarR family transcriptional regulator
METSKRQGRGPTGSVRPDPQTADEQLADLAERIVYVARRIRTHGHDDDRIVRLTMTESAVMRYVGTHPGTTPSEAAHATGIQRSNLSAALRELEAKGLVTLSTDERDARVVRLHPTPRSEANHALLRANWIAQFRAALEGEDVDVDACIRLLARLEDGLVATERDGPPIHR